MDGTKKCTVLKAVKAWAKAKGIYGNGQGYPGGAAWALLVASIVKKNKTLDAEAAIKEFYKTYSTLDFTSQPVVLRNAPEHGWIPNWQGSSSEVMAVITPCQPTINATYNVNGQTLAVIVDEMKKACALVNKGDFGALFAKPTLNHNSFLSVSVSAASEDAGEAVFGFLGVKIRNFPRKIEGGGVKSARLWPSAFKTGNEVHSFPTRRSSDLKSVV